MTMRSPHLFLVGLAIGAVLAWMLKPLVEEDVRAPAGAKASSRERARDAAGRGVGLRGRARARKTTEATTKDPKAPRATFSEAGAAALAEIEGAGFTDEESARAGWVALARLYALAGRVESYERAVELALAVGAEPGDVLSTVWNLPEGFRPGVLDRMLEKSPEGASSWGWMELASLYRSGGATERAIDLLQRTLSASNEGLVDMGAVGALIDCDAKRAVPFLSSLAQSRGLAAPQVVAIANLLIQGEHNAAAVPFLLRALELDPNDSDAIDVLATVDPSAALVFARRRVHDHPEDAAAWGKLGSICRDMGDTEAAFDAYMQAAELQQSTEWLDALLVADPERALPLIARFAAGSADDEVIGTLGDAQLRAGNTKAALASYLRAHERDPNDTEWLRALVRLDAAKAVAVIKSQIDSQGDEAGDELIGAYGNALLATGKKAQAFESYRTAHEKDVDDYEWLVGMANADPEQALPILLARKDMGVDSANVNGAIGTALAGVGRTHEALEHIERALSESTSSSWFRALAKIDPTRALDRVNGAIRNEPNNDELWGALGRVYADLGRIPEAREAFQRALELDPTDSEWRTEIAKTR